MKWFIIGAIIVGVLCCIPQLWLERIGDYAVNAIPLQYMYLLNWITGATCVVSTT